MQEELKDKINRLIALYEGERDRARNLADELSQCKGELQDSKRQIEELKNKIEDRQLRSAFTAGGGPEAKESVTALIKELDKCISLLEAD